jgi:hypothetical protein
MSVSNRRSRPGRQSPPVNSPFTAGRPLAAANADLPWPGEPHLVLWHAINVLREQRGDGHIAAV